MGMIFNKKEPWEVVKREPVPFNLEEMKVYPWSPPAALYAAKVAEKFSEQGNGVLTLHESGKVTQQDQGEHYALINQITDRHKKCRCGYKAGVDAWVLIRMAELCAHLLNSPLPAPQAFAEWKAFWGEHAQVEPRRTYEEEVKTRAVTTVQETTTSRKWVVG